MKKKTDNTRETIEQSLREQAKNNPKQTKRDIFPTESFNHNAIQSEQEDYPGTQPNPLTTVRDKQKKIGK